MVALLLGARPSGISIIPRSLGNGKWRLGVVHFRVHWASAGAVALAPLWVLAPLSFWGLWLRQPSGDFFGEILWGIFGAVAGWGALLSSTDIAIALRYPIGSAAILALSLGLWRSTGHLPF